MSRNAKVRENEREMEQLLSNANIFTKRKGERWNSYNQTQNYLLKGKGSFKRTERRVFGEYKEKVRVKLDKVSHRDIEREGVIVLIGKGE